MIKFVFLIASLSICATNAKAKTNNAGRVKQWNSFKVIIQGTANANPFTDITLSTTFTKGDKITEAKGFNDGNGTYKIRFRP